MAQQSVTNKTVPQLKQYLRERGVSVDNYRKDGLQKLVAAACKRNLPVERDNYDRQEELKKRR